MLGNGTTENTTYPIKIMEDVIAVDCGSWGDTSVIKADGSLWMWGQNEMGQLGNGGEGNIKINNHNCQSVPIKIMDNVSFVSCRSASTAVIKTDGSLWMWGYNDFGQLGTGILGVTSKIPIKILEDVVYVSTSYGHTAAIKSDNSLWMWGSNEHGALGNGYIGNSKSIVHGSINGSSQPKELIMSIPAKIMDNVSVVKCGGALGAHTIIVSNDGTVWTCGRNTQGQLGTNGVTNAIDENGANIQTIPFKLSGLIASLGLPTDFYDVSANSYYVKAIKWALDKEITAGTSSIQFSPEQTCTTAQIISFLWRANGFPEAESNSHFSDVDESQYYAKAAMWAYEKGLVTENVFNGDSPCTRSMVVKFLWILAGKPQATSNNFSDVPTNTDYSQAVSWALDKEITAGTSDTTFSPDNICTRGQIVTFLYRYFANQ